jgi:hypothetical protein
LLGYISKLGRSVEKEEEEEAEEEKNRKERETGTV